MKDIIKEVSVYCKEILTSGKCASLPFHNLTHTEEVVDGVKKICEEEGITGNDYEILIISAWFHVACIAATKLPQNPTISIAEVLCDADLFHVSTLNFFYRKLLLRKEWKTELGKSFTDLEWHHVNHDFLRNHQYFTEYGKKVLAKGQHENILKVENLIKMCNSGTQLAE